MAKRGEGSTPIEHGLIARVASGLGYAITGKTPQAWFGPLQPLPPVAPPEVKGRQWDYPVGYNLQTRQRPYEAVGFDQLRGLADGCDLVRLAVETRKDQLCNLQWKIQRKDEEEDDKGKEYETFFSSPDKQHGWSTWLRMLIEEVLVIDAPAIYYRPTMGKQPFAFELMDGATLVKKLGADGRLPLPPETAYQQRLKGLPAVDYTTDEIVLIERNPRVWKNYGYSPVEQVILTVNAAIRKALYQLEFYTEGNMPDALVPVPKDWTPDQIKQIQDIFDTQVAGNTAERRKMRFVPEGAGGVTMLRPEALKDDYDEWLARVICYAFSLPPTAFVKQVNRATADTAQEVAVDEGLAPLMLWVKNLIDYLLVKYFGAADFEFAWQKKEELDPLVEAQINEIYVNSKVLHPDEVRTDLGRDPLTAQQKEEMNPKPVDDTQPNGENKKPDDGNNAGKYISQVDLSKRKKKVLKPAKKNAERTATQEKAIHTAFTKFFREEKPVIITRLVTAYEKAGKADDDKVSKILEELGLIEWVTLVPELKKAIEAAAKDGGKAGLIQINIDDTDITNLVNTKAVEYAADRSAELVGMKWVDGELVEKPNAEWAISDGTRELLRSDISTAIDEGWSNQKLADILADNYAFSDTRAETIARTEVASAQVEGNMAAYRESGEVEGKQWILGADPCDVCLENADAGIIGLDDVFPSGDDAAPAHPNCLCDVVPVLKDNQED